MAKKDETDMQQPMMVSSHDIHLDADYSEWIAEVKHRYREDQDDTKLARGVREIIQRPVGDFPLPFALVPWGQHIEITTIGLLICSDMNKADVQWAFKGIQTPMGVATYNNIRIKDMLPTQEQLKERMELLKKELKHTKRLMNKK